MKISPQVYTIETLFCKGEQHIRSGRQQYATIQAILNHPALTPESLWTTFYQLQNNIECLHKHISESLKQYQSIEYDCINKANYLCFLTQKQNWISEGWNPKATAINPLSCSAALLQKSTQTKMHSKLQSHSQIEVGDIVVDTSLNVHGQSSIRSLLAEGIIGKASAAFYGIKASQYVQISKNSEIYGEISAVHAQLSGKVHGLLWKEKKIDPTLLFDVGASVALAKGLLSLQWDLGPLTTESGITGSIAEANAQGKVIINKKEITMEGEVGAALARGSLYGELKILGISIKAEIEGEVGGIGIGGSFSASNHSFEIGGKISCLLGYGVNLTFDW